jgi:hypothetical protein
VFYPIFSDQITQTVSWGATGITDSYGTWVFATPFKLPGLPAGTVYGFDIAMKSSSSAWQTGIPYPTYLNTNVFAGGFKYTCAQTGTQGSASSTVQPDSGRDREFHLDMDAITIGDTTAPTLVSIGDNVSGGPIYEDQVQVIYTLTFDEAINASTIDLADFENLGSGVSIDSVASVQNTTPYPAASVVKVVLGISGTGTLKLGVKSGSNIADLAAPTPNLVTSPAADDTMIAVNTGTNPGTGNRWWDGPTTTGLTNGASNGGSGTWQNGTTTTWDRGFGFAGPVAWNNSNNDNAIFGGTPGTVALGTDISLGNLTFDLAGAYTVNGGTLNFAPGSTIRTSDNRYSQTITSAITGSPAVETKDFGAGNTYLGFVFAPASGTQTLGTILNPNNTGNTDTAGVTLGGSTTGNSVVSIDYAGGDQYADVIKTGKGTWTSGNIRTGTIRFNQGTLVINGTATAMYNGFVYTAGTLRGNAMLRRNDRRGNHDILSGFTVAPGNGVGTITILDGTTQTPSAVQQFTTFKAGAIYEWEVGSASQDTVHIAAGKLQLDGFTLKILDAGGTPAVGTQLPVFTYDLAKLPKTSTTPGGDVLFTFVRDQTSIDGTTTVAIEVGTTLAAWPDSYSVPGTAVANNPGVTVIKDAPVAGKDTVTLTLPRAPEAKKFARLKVVVAP